MHLNIYVTITIQVEEALKLNGSERSGRKKGE